MNYRKCHRLTFVRIKSHVQLSAFIVSSGERDNMVQSIHQTIITSTIFGYSQVYSYTMFLKLAENSFRESESKVEYVL